MDEQEFVRTNISITPKQRDRLKQYENQGRSMSQLIRDAIDKVYPEPPPFEPEVSPNLQKFYKSAKVVDERITSSDVQSLFGGMTQEVYDKLYKRWKLGSKTANSIPIEH